MSFVTVSPELMSGAAADLAAIGSRINDAAGAAAVPTSSIAAPAADEVSAAVTALFNGQAQAFQALQAQAAAFHQQFVGLMNGGAAQYASAEAANAQQQLLGAVNGPFLTEFGRPLIGNGANGTAASPNGQPGGFLWGNGGNGFSEPLGGGNGGSGGSAGLIGRGGNGGNGGDAVDGQGASGGNGGNGGLLWGPGGTGGTGGSGGPSGTGVPGASGAPGGSQGPWPWDYGAHLSGGAGGAGGAPR